MITLEFLTRKVSIGAIIPGRVFEGLFYPEKSQVEKLIFCSEKPPKSFWNARMAIGDYLVAGNITVTRMLSLCHKIHLYGDFGVENVGLRNIYS